MSTTEDIPRRELEECQLDRADGLRRLTITVLRQCGVRRDGTVRTREYTTRYLVRRPRLGVVVLEAEAPDPKTGEVAVYTLTRRGCDCTDAAVRGRERKCKHWTAAEQEGLIRA